MALIVQVGGSIGRVAADMEVARLPMFDRTLSKVSGFVTVCKLYIKMKMRKVVGVIICARKISRRLEGECLRGVGRRRIGI